MIDFKERLEQLTNEKNRAEAEIKQIRNILSQKEQGYLILMGKMQEINGLISMEIEEVEEEVEEEE